MAEADVIEIDDGSGENDSNLGRTPDASEAQTRKKDPLPRMYALGAKVLDARRTGKGQHKGILFRQDKVRNLGRLNRVVCHAFDHYDSLIGVLKNDGFSFKICDETLAAVIAADIAFSAEKFQPKSQNRKVRELLKHRAALQRLNDVKPELPESVKTVPVKYAIRNGLKASQPYLKKKLSEAGYMESVFEFEEDRRYGEDTHRRFVDHLNSLEIFEYCWDLHFPDEVLVFNVKSDIQKKGLFKNKTIFLYNKAVYATIQALGCKLGSKVLDTCAAPGNKSTLIAQNCRSLVCCERNEKRFKILEENLAASGVIEKRECVTIHGDFLKLDSNDPRIRDCNMAVVDPSCSGGGDSEFEVSHDRIEKLANLQTMCLKKALQLPNMRTVVYSTCSRESRENEGVVKEILEWSKTLPQDNGTWKLEVALPSLPFRGNDVEFPQIGAKCLLFDKERTFTSVQFIAKFVRSMNSKAKQHIKKTEPQTRIKLKRLRQKQRRREKEKLIKKGRADISQANGKRKVRRNKATKRE